MPEQQQPTTDTHSVAWFLDRLAKEEGVLHALLVTADGLTVASSENLERDVADRTAAATSSLLSLASSLGEFVEVPAGTSVHKVVIDLPDQCIFVFRAGANTVLALAVAAGMTSPAGVVASSAAIKAIKGLAPVLAARERTRTP
ncbi:roadblock/LC7 domain-containing protein [Streptomyces californicus]|uniref:roadblock/LC7 domain-containing protein n=1 Tax=Streptomyces californicus TaxID=67351 RepID=UPI00379707AE